MAGLRPPHVPDKPLRAFADGDLSRPERACAGRSFQQRRDAAMIAVFTATEIRLSELAGISYDSDEPRTLAPHPGWPPAGRRYSSPTAFAKRAISYLLQGQCRRPCNYHWSRNTIGNHRNLRSSLVRRT